MSSARLDSQAPIGVFDSGLGGLTVASALALELPGESLVYLGDTARVPYGTRSPSTVVRYARTNMKFLREQGVKLAVVACNTVSAQGLGGLADGSELPVIGVIRPGARASLEVTAGGSIAVLGAPATIASNAYVEAIHEHAPGARVHQVACPLFVPLVEEGWLEHAVTRAVAVEYLTNLEDHGVDTIILGCTHYPLLSEVLRSVVDERLGEHVKIVDSATAGARATRELLDKLQLHCQSESVSHRFFVTDAPERVGEVGDRFWKETTDQSLVLEHVDLVVDLS